MLESLAIENLNRGEEEASSWVPWTDINFSINFRDKGELWPRVHVPNDKENSMGALNAFLYQLNEKLKGSWFCDRVFEVS